MSQVQTSFGIPVPHLDAPITGTDYLSTVFSEEVTAGLLKASRKRGPKIFSIQIASILVTCLRINPTPQDLYEQRIAVPHNPLNLRPVLSKNDSPEIVSAFGFNSLEVSDLLKYYPVKDDKETISAVWSIAKDLQGQMVMQKPWMYDTSKSAPFVTKTVIETAISSQQPYVVFCSLFFTPLNCSIPRPPLPLRLFSTMTNHGVLDHIVKHEYPIVNSQSSLKIVKTFFHCMTLELQPTLLPVALHAFTWDNKLHYSWSYSPTHMGEEGGKNEEGPATLAKFIAELEKVTILLSQDTVNLE